jgi:hypothetical protein
MNTEQVTSLIRQILLFGGGIAVGKGWIDNETMLAIVGALVTLATSAWAFKTRTKASIVASAASKVEVPASSQREAGIAVPLAPKH